MVGKQWMLSGIFCQISNLCKLLSILLSRATRCAHLMSLICMGNLHHHYPNSVLHTLYIVGCWQWKSHVPVLHPRLQTVLSQVFAGIHRHCRIEILHSYLHLFQSYSILTQILRIEHNVYSKLYLWILYLKVNKNKVKMTNCIAATNTVCCFLNIRQIIQTYLRTSQTCAPGFAVKITTRLKSSQLLLPPLVHYPRLIPGPPLFCQPLLTGLQKSILLCHMLRNACQQMSFSFQLPQRSSFTSFSLNHVYSVR